MPLIKTPARKGTCTRSSGDAEQTEDVERPLRDMERLPEVSEHLSGDATESTSAEALLRTVMEELRQLREEREQQRQQRERLETTWRLRVEELQRLQEQPQLSHINNGSSVRSDLGNSNENAVANELGYKLKPDNFDGTVPLREFFSQFELIARANRWNDEIKTIALASCLRGKARAVLECVESIESINYTELKAKLELRFGETYLAQSYYSLFTNRKQKSGEDEATLGSDIERLSQLAYPECSHQVREKIACAQFISALSNKFVRRTLQLEGVTSLEMAVQRAMTVKVILDNNSEKEKNYGNYNKRGSEERNSNFRERRFDTGKEEKVGDKSKVNRVNKEVRGGFAEKQGGQGKFSRECWQCGSTGHFRADCPSLEKEEKEN